MWPYILLLIIPLVIQSFEVKRDKIRICASNTRNNQNAMKAFWILLFLLLVLRHESIGRDLPTYENIFRYIARNDWARALGRSAEVGYSFINKVISMCTSEFRWVLIITAILEIVFIAKAYIKYSKDAILTIVLFMSISNFILLFSGLRQSIAISIGFLAFKYVKSKRVIAFLITVFIAMLIHTSAFMLLAMYPLYYFKITKKTLLFVIPLLVALLIFNEQIFGVLSVVLIQFTDYDTTVVSTGAYMMLVLFGIFACFSYIIPDESKMDEDTKAMRNYLLLAVALQMFAPLHNWAMRMNYYYMAFIPLLIPRIIECRSKKWGQVAILARVVMIVFFVGYFCITVFAENSLDTFPYRFYWESI